MLIKGSLGNGEESSFRVDKLTNSMITVDYAHHEIHDGSHYEALASDELALSGDHIDMGILTPGWSPTISDNHDTLYHMVVSFWASQPMSFAMYEDVTSFTGGSVCPCFNSNRLTTAPHYIAGHGVKETDLDVTGGVLTRTGGTLLLPLQYFGAKTDAGAHSRDEEIILKPASQYIFTLAQTANGANNCGIHLYWYESTPKY